MQTVHFFCHFNTKLVLYVPTLPACCAIMCNGIREATYDIIRSIRMLQRNERYLKDEEMVKAWGKS